MEPFKIGERQITAFQEDAERRYVTSVETFLKKNIPEAAEEKPEALTAFVTSMVNKAKEYGLTNKREAAVYVTTSYLLGENFEEHLPDAQHVLRSPLSAPDKAEWLQQATLAVADTAATERR
jgi:ribosomal protein L17